jgi:hypothetical protein
MLGHFHAWPAEHEHMTTTVPPTGEHSQVGYCSFLSRVFALEISRAAYQTLKRPKMLGMWLCESVATSTIT